MIKNNLSFQFFPISNFNIYLSKRMRYTIEIEMLAKAEIYDLYYIIRSYTDNHIFLCKKILVELSIFREQNNAIITQTVPLWQFKKMSFWDFWEWYCNRWIMDSTYTDKQLFVHKFYIMYDSKEMKQNKTLYPVYPWSSDVVKILKKTDFNPNDFQEARIKEQEKEIESLKRQLAEFSK